MIQIRHDSKRGCGFRKAGGLYLVSDGIGRPCGKLPIPLQICPTCGGGIHFCRSWTWVNGTALAAEKKCADEGSAYCEVCPLSQPIGRCGLLWIGEKFYATPADWTREANEQGVSRRIPAVPHGFEVGKTWVLVAHKKCIANPDGTFSPGVFHAFQPTAVEYVVKGDETPDEIESLEKRGLTPVKVEITMPAAVGEGLFS
jgi:hypothetical protein